MLNILRMKRLYFDAQQIKYTKGDYITTDTETDGGVMEIQGHRKTQEDRMVLSRLPDFALLQKNEREKILKATFREMQKANETNKTGSTACVAIANRQKNKVTVDFASVADSEVYFIVKGKNGVRAERLNELHTAKNSKEAARLAAAGRHIENGRINGLAVTRAIGDAHILIEEKDHLPHVDQKVFEVGEDEEAYLLVACDGLFERPTGEMADAEKEKFVESRIAAGDSPFYIALEMVGEAYRNGSGDNISAAVVPVRSEVPVIACVFDGHGGSSVSSYLAKHFLPTMKGHIANMVMDKKKQCLMELDKRLQKATREEMLDIFDEMKKRDGAYAYLHVSRNPSFDKVRLFFKSNKNNDEAYFFHTNTYQQAIKKIKNAYLSRVDHVGPQSLKREEKLIDYVRGNNVVHWSTTVTRSKLKH